MTTVASDLQDFMACCQARTDKALQHWLPTSESTIGRIGTERLIEAMRYSTLSTGKRFRPILSYATAVALDKPLEHVDSIACAVEFVHAYSLVHDDLPAMDNDDLRRGQATCHKAYDEATAILAGDAIHTLAFKVIACCPGTCATTEQRLQMIDILAEASGPYGMAGGQSLDLQAEGKKLTLEELENIHRLKTGALIRASVTMSALACGITNNEKLKALETYADCTGLAFQVQDDILDVIGDTALLGKYQGADANLNKATYPGIIGLEASQKLANELYQKALRAIKPFDEKATQLRQLAEFVVKRNS